MINIAELLKDCPKGTKLYSPLFGEVVFRKINSVNAVEVIVTCTDGTQGIERFHPNGKYISRCPDAECLLFPSKEVRTWEGWKAPKPHYDISNFKPFNKVLVRDWDNWKWKINFFGFYDENFYCVNSSYVQCIPYNEDTKHLLGTTDMCPEEYVNW